MGVLSGLVFPLALAWSLLAYVFVATHFRPKTGIRLLRLLPFSLLAFPWIVLDGDSIGWYFRHSGAIVNHFLFEIAGYEVSREGVHLMIQGLPLDVAADCDGLDTLQAMLVAGGALGWLFFSEARHYWWVWPLLLVFAWVANTLRIFVMAVAGLSMGADFAMGGFHDLGGIISVSLMFALCVTVFMVLSDDTGTSS